MIEVTKLNGEQIVVNADHIETVEAQPDTTLILDNGKRLMIREDVEEVVRKVLEYQGLIRSGAFLRDSEERARKNAAIQAGGIIAAARAAQAQPGKA